MVGVGEDLRASSLSRIILMREDESDQLAVVIKVENTDRCCSRHHHRLGRGARQDPVNRGCRGRELNRACPIPAYVVCIRTGADKRPHMRGATKEKRFPHSQFGERPSTPAFHAIYQNDNAAMLTMYL